MKRLQLKKGMRYSAQVAATIALGLAKEAMAETYLRVSVDKHDVLETLIEKLNIVNGADGMANDETYFDKLVHVATALKYTDGGKTYECKLTEHELYLSVDMLCNTPRVADLAGFVNSYRGDFTRLTAVLTEEAALDGQRESMVEKVFTQLQLNQSLSAILNTYPEAINYMPANMVEYVDAVPLIDLLKSA